jgi:FkbM family methyltransferase
MAEYHKPQGALYQSLKKAARAEVECLFSEGAPRPVEFADCGPLDFPYESLGTCIDTRNLFDIDELIIFSFYQRNRSRYQKVLDVGANLGLHSILLARCGYAVRCFEPDPVHFALLQRNIEANACTRVEAHNTAVSAESGKMEFCRVKGNTTGSHLKGAKANPYGELDCFFVTVEAARPHLEWADLVKMDVEGHEPVIICATDRATWQHTDAIVEIENAANAARVFEHIAGLGVNLFAQKTGWQRVQSVEDMPTSYTEGSLFISVRNPMPW